METERYTTIFYGVNTKFYTDEFVSYIWDKSAEKEFERSGIFVPALIDVRRLVCEKKRGCNVGDEAHVITTVRDPGEYFDEAEFFDALRNVILEVREELGMPKMSLDKQKIEFTYLMQP